MDVPGRCAPASVEFSWTDAGPLDGPAPAPESWPPATVWRHRTRRAGRGARSESGHMGEQTTKLSPDRALRDIVQPFPVSLQREDELGERHRALLHGLVMKGRLLLGGVTSTKFSPEERLIVRTVQGGRAWGFHTTVREVIVHPTTLYFVDTPPQVETMSLRRSERLQVFMPADIRTTAGPEDNSTTLLLKAIILDLSSGGARVFTRRAIPARTSLHLSFSLPGETHVRGLDATVLDSYAQESVFGQRIRFLTSERDLPDLQQISRWVQQNAVYAASQ